MNDFTHFICRIKSLSGPNYERDNGDICTVEKITKDGSVTEDMFLTLMSVVKEIKKLPDFERSIVCAYAVEDPRTAALICARANPKVTNRTVHYNRARKIFNRFVDRLIENDIFWPPR